MHAPRLRNIDRGTAHVAIVIEHHCEDNEQVIEVPLALLEPSRHGAERDVIAGKM